MQVDLLKRYRVFTATITSFILDYVYEEKDTPKFHSKLTLKCFAKNFLNDSFKFTLHVGDDKIQSLLLFFKIHSVNELEGKELQFLYSGSSLYGISAVGPMEEVFYIPFTPSCFGCGVEIKKPMKLFAIDSFIKDSISSGRPYSIILPK